MMWIFPALMIGGGALLVLNSLQFEDDRIARYVGAAIIVGGCFAALMRFISPMCYDGTLIGEALIRACG